MIFSWLKRVMGMLRRALVSLPAFVLLGLILGGLTSIWAIPKPNIATVTISGSIQQQTFIDDVLDKLKTCREDSRIKAVVLEIDSPGGGVCAIEQIYLDVLRLRQQKPVVVSIKTIAASGGYYVAVASDYIYAEPTSQIGSIGAWVSLPETAELDENRLTSGPFKASGGSKRKVLGWLETVRGQFVAAVTSGRGDRLRLSQEELSRAELYLGIEGLKNGLIDAIGTRSAAIEKAAEMAHIRNYGIIPFVPQQPSLSWLFGSSDPEALTSQAHLAPVYYYLYFESE